MENNNSKIIIACDFPTKEELYAYLEKFGTERPFLKLGMQIIYKEGFALIKELKQRGHQIFLDLKLHDIPVTVFKALKSLIAYEVDFITLHSLGGRVMLEEAAKAVEGSKTKLLAVTILTSMDQNDLKEINIDKDVKDEIETLMSLAKNANIHGVICSGLEANMAKDKNLIAVTPGIRIDKENKQDQKRVMTPEEAINNGASYLVIGRDLTGANDPLNLYREINERIK